MTIGELATKFGIEGVVDFDLGQGGLKILKISAQDSRAVVYLQGAHVAEWTPAGQTPVLWMSKKSWFESGKPLRGGVPICFPWFGPKADSPGSPNHGFARLCEWSVEKTSKNNDGSVEVVLTLDSASKAVRQYEKYWPGCAGFELRYSITVGSMLDLSMEVRNTGSESFELTEALHTYFNVSDVRNISILGLAGTEYISKVEGVRQKQVDELIRFTAETDRVYVNTQSTCVLDDPGLNRKISVSKAGSDSTVIWNPHQAKSIAMPDFGDDEWRSMVCIETANALDNIVTVQPGLAHTITARLKVQ